MSSSNVDYTDGAIYVANTSTAIGSAVKSGQRIKTGGGQTYVVCRDVLGTESLDDVEQKDLLVSSSSSGDADAIHDNVSAEISAITEKSILATGDVFIVEDSTSSFAKKKVDKTDLHKVQALLQGPTNSTFTRENNNLYILSASGYTYDLWASPEIGDNVLVINRGGGNNTIDGNGNFIESGPTLVLANGASAYLVFDGGGTWYNIL